MKFTIALPQCNRVSTPNALRDVAQAAEELGFWALSMHDHMMWDGKWVAWGSDRDEGTQDVRNLDDGITTYAHLAAVTDRVRLLFSIMLMPIREPLMTAKQLATLDQLSGGRVSFGIGIGLAGNDSDPPYLAALSGNARREWEALRVPVRRCARLSDERIAAMQALGTDDVASFTGELMRFQDVAMYPKPVQRGGIPILIGGNSPAALERTARGGFSWLPNHVRPEEVAMGVEYLKALHDEYGTAFTGEVVHDCFYAPRRLGGIGGIGGIGERSVPTCPQRRPRARTSSPRPPGQFRGSRGSGQGLRVSRGHRLDLTPICHSIDELLSMMDRFAADVISSAIDQHRAAGPTN